MLRPRSLATMYSKAALLGALVMSFGASDLLAANVDVNVRDRDGQSLPQVVVLLETGGGDSTQSSGSTTSAVVDQLHQQFVPGVIAVRTGTAISFPNSDSVSHQVYSFSPAKRFELGLYRGVPRDPVVFDKPGIVVLGCNIHDNMIGYVYVTDAPYFGTTDERGHFRTTVVPGKYRVHVWSPRFSKSDNAVERSVDANGDSPISLSIQVSGSARMPDAQPEARRLRDY
jgi:plastocyanin